MSTPELPYDTCLALAEIIYLANKQGCTITIGPLIRRSHPYNNAPHGMFVETHTEPTMVKEGATIRKELRGVEKAAEYHAGQVEQTIKEHLDILRVFKKSKLV